MNTEQHQKSKEIILDAAEKIFSLNGYKSTTIKKITAELPLSSAMTHYYFESKENLLFTVIERRLEYFKAEIIPSLNKQSDPYNKLHNVINQIMNLVIIYRSFFIFILNEIRGDIPKESVFIIKNFFQSILISVRKIIDEGIREKNFNIADSELTAYAILSTLVHAIIDESFGNGQNEAQRKKRIQDFFDKHFLNISKP